MRLLNTKIYRIVFTLLLVGNSVFSQNNEATNLQNNTLKLMSYNLKFASPKYQPLWEVRKEWQIDLIRQYSPDIIGTQEGLKEQVDYLQDELSEYVVVGEGRKGGDDDEHMAIFFKRDKFRLREMGSFQLSATPEVIGSGPEVNPRMVTWVRLAIVNRTKDDKTSSYPQDYRGHWDNTQEFYVFNTHFFNGRKDTLARHSAAKLIMKKMEKLNRFGAWTKERPVFLMGDFNCKPGSAPYKVLVAEEDSYQPHLFKDCIPGGKGIDWIVYKGDISVMHYERVDYNIEGVYPSDHKPIFTEVKINK